MVAFNKPGKNWDKREEHPAAVQAHVALYRNLAKSGALIFGARFDGEPRLGMSILCSVIDFSEIEKRLIEDPAVMAGIIALEIRPMRVQVGRLPCYSD